MLGSVVNSVRKMCSPAQFYVIVSAIAIIVSMIENMNNGNKFCLAGLECDLGINNVVVFIGQLIYTIVWAIILDSLCKNKYGKLAWTIVLLPAIVGFLMMLMIVTML